jgi:8-oxo-dGTP pyrophosphatase MutT (NUDIX family)
VTPIPAATVILVRERTGATGLETLLLRRHRKSSFMSDAFVFPGGKVDPDDASPEVAAIRELFEEAGVLLAHGAELGAEARDAWRARLNAGTASFADFLRETRLAPDHSRLLPWARWVTPSVEPKRFDARFYLALMPEGQSTRWDDKETVEELWITPDDALERQKAGGFKLPPPQVRTLHEMAPYARLGMSPLIAKASVRADHIAPIMPRFAELDGHMALLLPWDPEYETRGQGDSHPWPASQPLADGPSRFVLDGMSWRLEYPPASL